MLEVPRRLVVVFPTTRMESTDQTSVTAPTMESKTLFSTTNVFTHPTPICSLLKPAKSLANVLFRISTRVVSVSHPTASMPW